MTPDNERLLSLWTEGGLISEGIGPQAEWMPTPPHVHQRHHAAFWETASDMMPDDENEEPYWMTQDASQELLNN